jgi:7-cyano-7-deazaguanine synthase
LALEDRGALILFSGGQDSGTVLPWALSRFARVETIGFDYGQRHSVEMTVRQTLLEKIRAFHPIWRTRLGPDHIVDLKGLAAIGETAMTADIAIEMTDSGLPNTFVPGRNLAFFVMAGAVAYRRGLNVLVGGMCETDYSGYPDCRRDTIQAQEQALRLGMEWDGRIETPLMHITKAQSWALVQEIGGHELVELVNEHTHTCYRGERGQRHPWGYGCGTCPACELRARGWEGYVTGVA